LEFVKAPAGPEGLNPAKLSGSQGMRARSAAANGGLGFA
jgi:hypothetical protein